MLELTASDILHIRSHLIAPDGVHGLSPVAACRETLAHNTALAQHGAAAVANNAAPSGVLKVRGTPGAGLDEAIENVRQSWRARHQGPYNANRIAVLSADEVEFTGVSVSNEDLQYVESAPAQHPRDREGDGRPAGDDRRRQRLGDDLRECGIAANSQFVTHSLRPWLVAVEQSAVRRRGPVPAAEPLVRRVPAGRPLARPTRVSRAAVYTAALNETTGWMDR